MNKITIKNFVEDYNNRATESLKNDYIRDNLEVVRYVPFLNKEVLANKLVDVSTYKYEDYTKEDGTIGRRKTNNIHVNSTAQYLLFCRLVIENYTNLTVETEGFFEEYDMLKSSGLLDKLMVGTESTPPIIPIDEIGELRSLVDMKQKDALFNETEIHNFASSQVERFGTLAGITLKPILDRIVELLENMDEKDIEKLDNKISKFLKRNK